MEVKQYSKFTLTAFVRSFSEQNNIFKNNVRYILGQKGVSMKHLFRLFKIHGYELSRNAFIDKRVTSRNNKHVKLPVIVTFAQALCVPTWILLSDNIQDHWELYKKANPDLWNKITTPEDVLNWPDPVGVHDIAPTTPNFRTVRPQ